MMNISLIGDTNKSHIKVYFLYECYEISRIAALKFYNAVKISHALKLVTSLCSILEVQLEKHDYIAKFT